MFSCSMMGLRLFRLRGPLTLARALHGVTSVKDERGVYTVTLDRPPVNSFDPLLVQTLAREVKTIGQDADARAVVLTGAGKVFSAGADLNYMQQMVNFTHSENVDDSLALFDMFRAIHALPVPVIGRINGSAIGGGVGLVAVCDMAVAVAPAKFGLTEVQLGLMPAVISPFVSLKINRHSNRFFLTGELFSARQAHHVGLVTETVETVEELDEYVNTRLLGPVLRAGPNGVKGTKEIISHINGDQDRLAAVRPYLAEKIAKARVSSEAQQRLKAFLEKSK